MNPFTGMPATTRRGIPPGTGRLSSSTSALPRPRLPMGTSVNTVPGFGRSERPAAAMRPACVEVSGSAPSSRYASSTVWTASPRAALAFCFVGSPMMYWNHHARLHSANRLNCEALMLLNSRI